MYEYAVDRNSGQFKAPFNQIKNEPNVFTYKDTAIVTPNSDTPYSLRVAGFARGADRAVGPGGGPEALLLGAARRRQYLQLRLYRQPRHRKRGRATTWWSGRTGRARPRRESRRCSGRARNFLWRDIAPSFSIPDDIDNVQEGPGRLQGAAAVRLPEAAGAAAPRRPIDFPKIDKELVKTNFFEYLDFALQFAPAQANEKEIRAQLAASASGRARPSTSRTSRWSKSSRSSSGMKEGERKIDEAVDQAGKDDQRLAGRLALRRQRLLQWRLAEARGAAKAGIYGNDAVEAMYPSTRTSTATARRSTAASTTTRCTSRPGSCRR